MEDAVGRQNGTQRYGYLPANIKKFSVCHRPIIKAKSI